MRDKLLATIQENNHLKRQSAEIRQLLNIERGKAHKLELQMQGGTKHHEENDQDCISESLGGLNDANRYDSPIQLLEANQPFKSRLHRKMQLSRNQESLITPISLSTECKDNSEIMCMVTSLDI